MANLTFKKGLYSSDMFGTLSGSSIKNFAEGTVYITTDEQAMYVDTYDSAGTSASNQKRIRIQGAVQYFATLAEFEDGVKPPYSSDVIYFIADKNALVRYDSVNSKWIQLNMTADSIQKAIDDLTTAINNNTKAIETNSNNIATNKAAIATNTTNIATNKDNIATNKADIATNKADIATNKADITALKTTTNNHGTRISNLESTVETQSEDIEDLKANKAEQTDLTALTTRVTANENSITSLQDNKADKTTVAALTSRVETNEEDIATLNSSTIPGIQTAIETITNKNTEQDNSITALQGQDATHTKDIQSNAEDIAELQELLNNADTGLAARVTTLENEMDTAQGDIENNATAIEKNSSDITNLKEKDTALDGQISGLDGRLTTVEGKVSTLETKMTTAEGNISSLQGRMTTAESDIDKLEGALDTFQSNVEKTYATKTELATAKTDLSKAIDDAEAALSDQISTHIRSANAMVYKKGVKNYSELPTTGVQVGETYIVTSDFRSPDGEFYYPGDIVIASGPEDDSGFITTLEWVHVESGYAQANAPQLSAVAATNGATVNLTSLGGEGTAGDLGAVSLISANENLTVSVSGSTITVNSVWGSF